MSTPTKEWLQQKIAGMEATRDEIPFGLDEDDSNTLAALRIALASLEAEAVAFVMADDLKDSCIISTPAYRDLGEAMERTVGDVVALYAAPPATVSIEAGSKLSNFFASQESLGGDFEKVLTENIEELYVPGNSVQPAPVSVPDDEQGKPHPVMAVKGELGFLDHFDRIISERDEDIDIGQLGSSNYEALMLAALDAFRAAMLQGAEPVTTAYKLPFEQWLSQQTGTIDVECGCVMTEVFFHWLRVAYEAGNSPATPDGWVACSERMPDVGDIVLTAMGESVNVGEMERSGANYRFFTSVISGRELPATHWMPLPAAPLQEVK